MVTNGKLTNTIKSPGSLTLGADLDNLSVGVYQITGVKINVSGTTVTVWGTIIVCRRAFDYQQVILSNGTKAIYYRSKNESEAWTEWKQLITNTDLNAKALGTSNLNDIKNPGTYFQTHSGNATVDRSYPVEDAGFLEVMFAESGFILQKYNTHSSAAVYKRTYNNSGWNGWKQV